MNSLVWIRCPKHKWHGKGWVFCWGSHQKGKQQKRLWANIKAEKRIQDQHKKYRVAGRQAKQKDEEQRRQKEGTTYGAGAFNELTVATEPARKRKER